MYDDIVHNVIQSARMISTIGSEFQNTVGFDWAVRRCELVVTRNIANHCGIQSVFSTINSFATCLAACVFIHSGQNTTNARVNTAVDHYLLKRSLGWRHARREAAGAEPDPAHAGPAGGGSYRTPNTRAGSMFFLSSNQVFRINVFSFFETWTNLVIY